MAAPSWTVLKAPIFLTIHGLARVKMGEDEKRKNSKNEKTKVVVWDAVRTAIEPEKKI